LATLFDRLKSWPLYILPHHLCSRLIFKLTRIESGLVPPAIRLFSRVFNVALNEARHPDSRHYKTFNEFFTRELANGARTIDADPRSIACPVDGRVSQAGRISSGEIIQAKQHRYTVDALLGGREQDSADFQDGLFATLYLSPRDYHRIHMPIDDEMGRFNMGSTVILIMSSQHQWHQSLTTGSAISLGQPIGQLGA